MPMVPFFEAFRDLMFKEAFRGPHRERLTAQRPPRKRRNKKRRR